jgi:hypothetical protein
MEAKSKSMRSPFIPFMNVLLFTTMCYLVDKNDLADEFYQNIFLNWFGEMFP